ncbi:MAG: hypothetical protein GY849_03425, partial [Deltaproteobacteria bacterium]|nr:hypothetical protein [Deltaproteobacteria bacterium]
MENSVIKRFSLSRIFFSPAVCVLLLSLLFLPSPLRADLSLIKKGIADYNLEQHKKSLSNGAYRGEEGMLGITPEVGRSFGLAVHLDQDYLEARKGFAKADKFDKDALRAMRSRKKEKFHGQHVQRIAESALLRNRTL